MKLIDSNFFLCAAAVLLFSSCSDKDDIPSILLDETAITVEGMEGEISVAVETAGIWTAESDAKWCSVIPDPDDGSVAVVRTETNTTLETRTASVVFSTTGSLSQTLNVTQKALTDKTVLQQTLSRESEGITHSLWDILNLGTDTYYRYSDIKTVINSAPEWSSCTIEYNESYKNLPDSMGLSFKCTVNDSGQGRKAIIFIVMNDGNVIAITYVQSIYEPGDYYENGSVRGVVIDGNHIISLDEAVALEWSKETREIGAKSQYYGEQNTRVVMFQDNWRELYPAFKWCCDKNLEGENGWYVPAVAEITELTEKHLERVNPTLETYGTPLTIEAGHYYISSTELDQNRYLVVEGYKKENSTSVYITSKDMPLNEVHLRAFRKVNIPGIDLPRQ